MSVTHTFVSAEPPSADPNKVGSTEWNDGHVITYGSTPGTIAEGNHLHSGVYATGTFSVPITAPNGGTGIINTGTFTNQSNTIITGGGTVSLGGFALTIPATGIAALLATANVFTTQQMVDGSSDQIQLRVQGNATQTTNIQTWESSAGTVLSAIDGRGTFQSSLGTNGTNLFIGTLAGNSTTIATTTVAIGYSAGLALDAVYASANNFFMGYLTGYRLKRAESVTAIGSASLSANFGATTTISYHTAIGSNTLAAFTGGGGTDGHTAIGSGALAAVVSGGANTALGRAAGFLYTASNGIFIGHGAGWKQTTGDGKLVIDGIGLRATSAAEITDSIIYGVMAATPAAQTLRLNAYIGVNVTPTVAGITFADANDLVFGTATGTKIGTATTQKLGFYNATPIVRPSAYTPTNVSTDRSYDANATTVDEIADVLGTLIADLQSLGLVG